MKQATTVFTRALQLTLGFTSEGKMQVAEIGIIRMLHEEFPGVPGEAILHAMDIRKSQIRRKVDFCGV